MWKNYLKVAFRSLRKNSFYSLLNIFGLSIGIASGLMILLFVHDDLSYDKFHDKTDQIYRVWLNGKMAGQELNVAMTSPPVGPTAAAELPEVKAFVRLDHIDEEIVRFDDRVFNEENVYLADSTFFDVFSFALLQGDPKTCLVEPNSAVITERLAAKYFDDEPPMGKTLTVGSYDAQYKITGVVADPPENSHFDFDLLYSMSSNDRMGHDQWFSNGLFTYLLVEEGTTPEVLDRKIQEMTERHLGPLVEKAFNTTLEGFKAAGNKYGYHPQAITDIHLDEGIQGNPKAGSNMKYIYIFSAIALFIIIIACINFMNMATAKSAGRAKEVGLRKTLGSARGQLIAQFIAESVLIALISSVLALIITSFVLGWFNDLSGKSISLGVLWQPEIIAGIILLVLLVGFLAGSYPAFYLSHFSPAAVLKGKISGGIRSKGIRNGLVVFQFFISIFLIVCTLLIYKQVEYTRSRDLGFEKENVIILSHLTKLENNRRAFKEAITGRAGYELASYSDNALPNINNKSVFRREGVIEDHIVAVYSIDYDYLETMGMKLEEGRNFSLDFPTDTAAAIINEAMVKEMGYEEPLKENILSLDTDPPTPLKIVGVVKDFSFETVKQPATPLILRLNDVGSFLTVRIPPGNPAKHIEELKSVWREYAGDEPFNYRFIDDEYGLLFKAEQRMGEIFTVFSALAIAIACLGLFGLAAYTSEQRTKEVGIRKVLGASVPNVMYLLSKDFAILIAISFVIAIPVVIFVMDYWLMEFAYRISIGPGVFVIAGAVAFLIASITVSFQSLKAATINPVKSLKYE